VFSMVSSLASNVEAEPIRWAFVCHRLSVPSGSGNPGEGEMPREPMRQHLQGGRKRRCCQCPGPVFIEDMNDGLHAYQLRPAIEADHDAIAEIWHGSASLSGVGPLVMPAEAEMRERVAAEFAGGWNVTVAVRAHEIVGFVAIEPGEAVLAELFVRPASIGSGIGRALLAHAMSAMPQGFTLITRSTNLRARDFYEKAGLVALRDDRHPRTGDPVICYGWNIR
ncbi:MAG: N-acetyltransferase, partial [Rhizobium sp.]